jgi:trigger factor
LEYELKVDHESEKEVEILVPVEELAIFMEHETDKLRKDTSVKGFRKGRVPREIIKTKFKDTIKAQALNDLITKYYFELLTEKKWQPAAPVQLLNIEEGNKIKFQMRLEIVPEFTVENYIGLEIIKEKPLPPEHLMNETLNNMRERAALIQEVNGQAAVDNFVTMDLEIIENNQVKSSEKDIMIRIGDRNFPDEVNRALVGAQKGQYKETQAANQIYKMTIKKVEEKILPNIDETFAKNLGFENLEALKKQLADDLRKREEMRIEEEMKESIAQVLLERVRFNTPKSMINNEYQDMIKRNNLPDSDATKERFWDMAEKRVRFNLILDKIAVLDNIAIDESEVLTLIEHMGMKLNDDNRLDIITYFRRIMTRQKAIEYLLKNGKISEKGRILSPKEASDANRTVRH